MKILLITALIFASLFIAAVGPVAAQPDYDKDKYDPVDDVIRMRSSGTVKFATYSNVDIIKMTSSYDDKGTPTDLDDEVTLTMTVEGDIDSSEPYKYAFVVNEDYIFALYNGDVIGWKIGDPAPFSPLRVTGGGSGSVLTITFDVDLIGSPSSFDFKGAALFSQGDYERFVDLAPDKLILITEPSDHSTVGSDVTIKGVVRDSTDGKPNGGVRIKIDDGSWQAVSGNPWSYSTTLADGEHTIYAEVQDPSLDTKAVEDQITIRVHSNAGDTTVYKSFDKDPVVHVGDWYEYRTMGSASIAGIPLNVDNKMETNIISLETIDGTEVYKVQSYTTGKQELGYVTYNSTTNKTAWRKKAGFGVMEERTISTVDITLRDETTVDTFTEYTTPFETHDDFSITVGFDDNKWSFYTSAHSESTTHVPGGTTTNPDFNENLNVIGECLYHLDSINTHGNTFEDIYVIRTYYENPGYEEPGVSVVEYYSPDMGVPVMIETYDPSRNLMFSLGLYDWEQMPFSIDIGDVTFNPSKPKADEKCQITVPVKNIGVETASNLVITVEEKGKQVAQETIASISSGETEELKVDWTPKSEGNRSIKITASYGDLTLAEKTFSIRVEPKEADDVSSMLLIPLIIVIVIAVVVVIVLLKRRQAGEAEAAEVSEGEEPKVTEGEEAGAVVVAVEEAEAEPEAEPEVEKIEEAAPQEITETIQCPSCKNAFTIKFESKPVRVKCPSCGTEGVLK